MSELLLILLIYAVCTLPSKDNDKRCHVVDNAMVFRLMIYLVTAWRKWSLLSDVWSIIIIRGTFSSQHSSVNFVISVCATL